MMPLLWPQGKRLDSLEPVRLEVSVKRAEGAEAYQPRASESASAALGSRNEKQRALKGEWHLLKLYRVQFRVSLTVRTRTVWTLQV